jgi:hypothetical protein
LLAKVDCFAKSANQNVEIQQKSETYPKGLSMGGWSKGAQNGAKWKPRNTNYEAENAKEHFSNLSPHPQMRLLTPPSTHSDHLG